NSYCLQISSLPLLILYYKASAVHRHLHSFPTRRSSDLIDPEHLEHYGGFAELKDAFVEFVEKVPFYGLAVLCLDHPTVQEILPRDRKSTRLNSSHVKISYAVFCLKKKK